VASEREDAKAEYDQVMRLTPSLENGRRIYRTCAVCHRPEGWGTEDGTYPQIAGQHRSVLIKQLADIRAGNRDAPEMAIFARKNVVGGYQGIADVIGYVATLPMNPQADPGPGDNLALGQQVFEKNCARCHGDKGEGDDTDLFPSLYGQHYAYLLRELRWIKEGKRRNVYRGMVRRVQRLSDAELAAAADYASRLKPPPEKVAPVGWRNTDIRGPAKTP